MAKKTNKPQINADKRTVDKQADESSTGSVQLSRPGNFTSLKFSGHALIAGGIAVVTWLVYSVCLGNLFTNWDDAGYIVNNPIIRDISPAGLRAIFLEPVMGNYHPLTILSYAIEFNIVGLDPWLYHFDSLVAHIVATVLIYWLVNLLTKRPVAAIVTSLLFALHPMHVESVAWAAGRKDLYCCVFFIASAIAYVYYLRAMSNFKWKFYAATIIFFICALLSKPVAVTLPVVLLLIDYLEGRKRTSALLTEKIPHFALALIFGIISVRIQHGGGAMSVQKVSYDLIERIALSGYALITYLWKAVAPANLCCFYPYLPKINGHLPVIDYLYPAGAAAIIFVSWKYGRGNRIVVFGLLFFLVNISLLLQFIPVGEAILAERYTYIPYFGLFFIAGWLVSGCFEDGVKNELKYSVVMLACAYIAVMGYLSSERCKIWYDSTSLWSDEIKKEPGRVPLAYNNLGFIYFDKWAATVDTAQKNVYFDSAFFFMNKAIQLKPDFVNPYQGLGMLYYSKRKFEESAFCFRTAMKLQPTAEAHSDFGNLLNQTGKVDSALMEYGIAISMNPNLYVAFLNRGRMYKDKNRWGEARNDFDKAIEINPKMGELYYERSFCDTQQGNTALALQDVDKAISLGFTQFDNNYYQGLKGKVGDHGEQKK